MRAIVYRRFGGPGVLEHAEIPPPRLARDSVLVKVRTAGMNHADLALRAGAGADLMATWFPVVPGWDVAGVVESVGADVQGFREGDEVIGLLRSDLLHVGSYVERVVAPEHRFVRKPASLDWAKAAALPLAGLTAWQAVIDCLRIQPGETLLVHGGSGSVGSIALQLAVRMGARAIGSGSDRHHSFIRFLGAEPVCYGSGLDARVLALAPEGVDAVLDCVGRGTLRRHARLGRAGVRGASIVEPVGDVRTVYPRIDLEPVRQLAELAARGDLHIRIAATYPLAFAASATKFLESGCAGGKVVLTVP